MSAVEARLFEAARRLEALAGGLRPESSGAAERLEAFAADVTGAFHTLNPSLPGAARAQERLAGALEGLEREVVVNYPLRDLNPRALDYLLFSYDAVGTIRWIVAVAAVRAMYEERGREAARARGVDLLHSSDDPLASHAAAMAAASEYDVALIVGPEGFAYEPMFADAGLETVAVNVPESERGGPRTFQALPGENLDTLGGRRVLVVEDDVRTGATLRAVLRALPVPPATLGLYLGSPDERQILSSIPAGFSKVHLSSADPDEAPLEFLRFLHASGIEVFRARSREGP